MQFVVEDKINYKIDRKYQNPKMYRIFNFEATNTNIFKFDACSVKQIYEFKKISS
jgi:hypothetical protein